MENGLKKHKFDPEKSTILIAAKVLVERLRKLAMVPKTGTIILYS